ncbi:hypothetical protein ABPG72_000736 [Tetrahymena utriculariae]
MNPIASEGAQSKQFVENKEIVQNFLESVDKKSLDEIKQCISKIEKKIKKKQNAYSQFSSVRDLINTIKDGNGRSCLHFAASRGDIPIFEYLLNLGAEYNTLDNEKNNPFFIAAQHGHLEIIQYIVDKLKQDPLAKREGDASAIHLASSNGDLATIEYLISKGASIEEPSSFGFPINWAAGYNHIKTVEFLLQKGASPNGDRKGVIPSPLILSVDYGKQDLFDLLISYNADVNVTDPNGWSVLHLCAEKGNIPFMNVLLEKGANPNYLHEQKTPLQLGFEHGNMDLYQILKKHTKNDINQELAEEFKTKLNMKKEDEEFLPKTIDNAKAVALKNEGNELFRISHYEEALQKYLSALEFDSSLVAIHTNVAACYIFLKRFEEGLRYTNRAKKVDPEWIKTYFREGEIYNGIENYSEAAASFWECLKREPTNKLYKDLFNIAMTKGKIQYQQLNKKQSTK